MGKQLDGKNKKAVKQNCKVWLTSLPDFVRPAPAW